MLAFQLSTFGVDDEEERNVSAEAFIVWVPIAQLYSFAYLSLLTTEIFQSHFSFLCSPFYVWCELSMPFASSTQPTFGKRCEAWRGEGDETNKNSLPFSTNKLDFYSTPLARSRYLPPDGSFSRFESCRIKARFKLLFPLDFFLALFFSFFSRG
jgi:hypothetical protein